VNRPLILTIGAAALLLAGAGLWFAAGDYLVGGRSSTDQRTLPSGNSNDGARKELVPVNVKATILGLSEEKDEIRRAESLDQLIGKIDPADIPAFLDEIASRGNSTYTHELTMRLLTRWVESNPHAAATWAGKRDVAAGGEDFLGAVAVAWARRDLASSIAWARELPEEERGGIFLKIAYQAVESDPRKALELARELAPTESRDGLVTYISSIWAAKSPQDAAAWASQIQDRTFRERVLVAIATTWGENDPVLASSLAISSLTPGREQNDAVVGIVQRWTQKDPGRAAAWVEKFPESELRNTALNEVVRLWTDNDLIKSGEWVKALPAGPARYLAIETYVGKAAKLDPGSTASWVLQIQDKALRERQMERVGEAWLSANPAEARQWIQESELPADVKERLLSAENAKGAD
jgi:hypothetical protein